MRPREWDREKLKWQILHWAELPNSLNLNAFCCLPDVMIDPPKLLSFVREDPEFRQVYDTVKAFLAVRREEANAEKVLSNCAYAMNHHVYDLIAKEEKREELRFEKGLDKQNKEDDNHHLVAKFEEFLNQFDSLRSKRKILESNISTETKS